MNCSNNNHSAGTSRNQVPALFRRVPLTGINLDIGGGRFDRVEEEYGAVFTNLVYDPYNRTDEHNDRVLRLADRGIDSVTIANVLNVLKTDEEIQDVLRLAASYEVPIFVSVYEGDKTGILKRTRDGWQRNARTGLYVPVVREVRPGAYLKKGVIYA